MGRQDVERELDSERLRLFTKKLLADLRVIEQMLAAGKFETGVRRVGAEQELFLVDDHYRAAPRALQVLETIGDSHYTTELGAFNLEFNLDPFPWGGNTLRQMEQQLVDLLDLGRRAAAEHKLQLVLTGILPTLEKSDLSLESMTPKPRYFALNEAMGRLRGRDYNFYIKGKDELNVTHDNVMLEACNTSFQIHFQVSPHEFAQLYNIAQVIAAPILAASANSPLLFGKRLWRETRIALFQQSIDTRVPTDSVRQTSPRVRFGRQWLDDSVIEIFREDISRFRVLLAADIEEDSEAVFAAGGVPKLEALRLFNGTIYRWNRPCYGISEGLPHLRIENRVVPAGPSLRDEMANAAFWFGLMSALTDQYPDIRQAISFDHVKENFVASARLGIGSQFSWIGGKTLPAAELITKELAPLAREGLKAGGIDSEDIDTYMGVLEERVAASRTGSQWVLDSYSALREKGPQAESLAAIVAATIDRQKSGEPVARWAIASLPEAGGWQSHYLRLGQIMTTDLFTVNEDELVDLAASMMDWRKIRHVPVEDNEHHLVGLVTHRAILRLLAKDPASFQGKSVSVGDIMERKLITATPETTTLDAINLLREHRIGCLPIVDDDRLVGIVTERDFMQVAGQLLEEVLQGRDPNCILGLTGQ